MFTLLVYVLFKVAWFPPCFGGKKTFKRYLKSEHTHRRTDRRTNRLIESIGPEGRCFEKPSIRLTLCVCTLKEYSYLNSQDFCSCAIRKLKCQNHRWDQDMSRFQNITQKFRKNGYLLYHVLNLFAVCVLAFSIDYGDTHVAGPFRGYSAWSFHVNSGT